MLANKTIVLGVSGSIAVYKAADLASKLIQVGAKVQVIMTEAATKFVTPLTFGSLTSRPVVTDMFDVTPEFSIEHVALAEAADIIAIAPATADIIAKLAGGIADDMLTSVVLATRAPVIIAPAMHNEMWENLITQENIARLKARGFTVVDTTYGRLASGKIGLGRLADVDKIIDIIRLVLGRNGDLDGKRIVVTAAGSREAIDPVRFIGNRSSGKMGFATAEAARDRGAKVILITAPTALREPAGVEIIHITSAREMKEAVVKAMVQANALIMAAAVADYEPKSMTETKIKKDVAGESLTLELVQTPDILSEVRGKFIRVGFAAESENVIEHARDELIKKQLDLIIANDITDPGAGFEVDTNIVTMISRDGKTESLPLMLKRDVADRILDRVVELLVKR
ncbi:bifunctional phosphopantothenoylcysteine decarboxylase/phosphopantothenate--cysteine ligase CoaBC [Chloroflexota bacterium]